jgi:acyl-CoA thioesterase
MEANNKNKALRIFECMMENDSFSAWLGLTLDEITEGNCRMHYLIKPEMLNGFGKTHGGILFAASDSVFAFACNSHGLAAVALEASIHYFRSVHVHETLNVTANLVFLGNKTGVYDVRTENEKGELVCQFKGTSYRSNKPALQLI